MSPELYFDSNATTEVLPLAADAVLHALTGLSGNPSSVHSTGLRARALREDVRRRAVRVLGVGEGSLMFNSGATEGIQTAVLSALCAIRARREHGQPGGTLLLYGATEHKAVPESLAHWNRVLGLDLELRSIAVDGEGRHDLVALRALAPQAALVCTMAANNETGTISDLDGIAAALAGGDALWLVDCVQALGKLPLRLAQTRIDYAPFSGHKLYAPKGIGMLYVRAGAPFTPLMVGGGQEAGLRAGTENMPGIAALGAVLRALEEGGTLRCGVELERLRTLLLAALTQAFPGLVLNTPLAGSLPTTLNFSVPGLAGGTLLDLFDAAGVRVSAGSACSSARAAPSYVLEAMGLPAWRCANAIRLSFGPATDEASVRQVCERILFCGAILRGAGAPDADGRAAPSAAPGNDDDTAAPVAELDGAALRALLRDRPDTVLVDVREAFEHLAGAGAGLLARAVNVPLGQLDSALPGWLDGSRHPLVFFCRSGARSTLAARRLGRLGHGAVFQLAGGLALSGAGLADAA